MRILGPLALGLFITALGPSATADEACPVPEGASPALSAVSPTRRLSYVTGALDEAGRKSDQWGAFWRTTFEVAAVAQFGMARGTKNDATRIDLMASAFKSSVGFLFALVFRLPAERHYHGDHPWEEEGSVCARLAKAEAALEKDAKFEQRARGVGMHVLGLSFNIGVGVFTYLTHHRLWSTASAMVVGGAVGEARVFTTPTVATESLAVYRTGALEPRKVSFTPLVLPRPGGAEAGFLLEF